MNLRSLGPVAGETITVKVKCMIPFSEPSQWSVRGSLVIKTDGIEFKMFYKKNVIY